MLLKEDVREVGHCVWQDGGRRSVQALRDTAADYQSFIPGATWYVFLGFFFLMQRIKTRSQQAGSEATPTSVYVLYYINSTSVPWVVEA